ncbi:MAG: hypothetical protein HKN58_04465 [Xanthomonadales bacterium]|nr:hypothetical protein [Xanthomonadales bacterium]
MEFMMDGIRWVHVLAGFIGLAAFWVPIFAHKGGVNHRFYGKIFKYCAYIVLFGAMLSVSLHLGGALADGVTPRERPSQFGFLLFLGYLAIVTYVGLRHGMQVLASKRDITTLDTPANRGAAWLSVAASVFMIAYALYYRPPNMIILLALSPVGFSIGFGILKAIRGRRPEKKVWFYEHMGAMLGTGIAFHTAFAVFGSSRIFNLGLEGWIAVLPWITPALIGIPATIIWTNYYKKKFNDVANKGVTPAAASSP